MDIIRGQFKKHKNTVLVGNIWECLFFVKLLRKQRDGESIEELVCRVDKLQVREREAVKVGTRLKKAKQFNRKVKFNSELRNLNTEIKKLSR